MIVDERMTAYIRSLDTGESELIREIAKHARENGVPIIRQETASLLRVLIKMTKPKKILEVGTAVGFSALLMSEHAPSYTKITTIEKFQKRIDEAKVNFENAGAGGRIRLLEGGAMDILKGLEESYDFIFMDAAKGQYIHFLPEVMRLLSDGGTLVSDNVLQDGDVIESRYAVTRRNRTIHSRMRDYLWELKHRDDLETVILPIGDGVTISTKI